MEDSTLSTAKENDGGANALPPPNNARQNALFIICLLAMAFCHASMYRRYFPNQWLGDMGMFGFALWQPVGMLVSFSIAASFLLQSKRTVPLVFLTLIVFVPCFIPFGPGPEFRLRSERDRYLVVVRSGERYGDQHEEVVDGRRLIYWRWVSWGLDNSIGVIYDPEDRLTQGSLDDLDRDSPDFLAFYGIAKGHLGSARRMGNGLYLVTHT